jgi:hypothetical protein
MVKQSKIGRKTKILFNVLFLGFFFDQFNSQKKGGVKISKTSYAVFV